MKRSKGRFSLVVGAVALLSFLILFQYALLGGLITQFIGGLRNQSAPLLIYGEQARRNVEGSQITDAQAVAIARVEGVERSGPLGEGTFTVTAKGELTDAVLFGYELGGLGQPTTLTRGRLPTSDGEAVASFKDRNDGFGIGDLVRLEPRGDVITVVGLAKDLNYSVAPTLFVSFPTYETARQIRNPDARDVRPSLYLASPAIGVDPSTLAARIDAAVPGVETLTRSAAVENSPGVAQVRSSFNLVLALNIAVVPLVIGLFFLIITFQKTAALTLLRAIGAPARVLGSALVIQAVSVITVGMTIGAAAVAAAASAMASSSVPISFSFPATFVIGGIVLADRTGERHVAGRSAAMKIAWAELRRRPGRFAVTAIVLTLLSLLLLFLGGLLDGLYLGSTGALRAQDADVIVFSTSSRQSLLRSRIEPDLRGAVETAVPEATVGGLGVALLAATVPGKNKLANVAVLGYQIAPKGVPAAPADGEAYADETLRDFGVRAGQVLTLGPAGVPVKVVGFVSDTNYLLQGALWTNPSTWRAAQNANRPDAFVAPDVFQALVVSGDQPASDLIALIDGATAGATTSLTRSDAANGLPGVKEQKGTFNQIISTTLVVAIVVVALFFSLLTLERTPMYGVLKAVGAKSRQLFAGVVLQATVVTLGAFAVGATLATVVAALIPPGSIPLQLVPARYVTTAVSMVVAAIVGSFFSLRRVLKVDPASAIGSGS
jgi:putative ABC transport system permease protein